jgi:hypothetical protein
VWAGGAVGADAPGSGHRGGLLLDPGGEFGDLAVQEGDLVQQQLGELAVVVAEHAIQRLDEVVVLGLHLPAGQGGQLARVAFPGDQRPHHVLRRQGGQLAGHRRDLDQRAFQQLFQPLPAPGALLDQPGACPGVVPQRPDRRRRDEAGAQQPISVSRASHIASSLSVFGRPGRFLA